MLAGLGWFGPELRAWGPWVQLRSLDPHSHAPPHPHAPLVVCRYLHKPYLIGGSKFDLRIYVYVTCYDPLRIYLFRDGLVRFASCK